MYTYGVTINVIRIGGEMTCAIPFYQSDNDNENDDLRMCRFMPIGPKLWALEGYTRTDRQADRQT